MQQKMIPEYKDNSRTIVVQVGNVGSRLPQWEWVKFYKEVEERIERYIVSGVKEETGYVEFCNIFFKGMGMPDDNVQHACWVFSFLPGDGIAELRSDLEKISQRWKQPSFAWTVGNTDVSRWPELFDSKS